MLDGTARAGILHGTLVGFAATVGMNLRSFLCCKVSSQGRKLLHVLFSYMADNMLLVSIHLTFISCLFYNLSSIACQLEMQKLVWLGGRLGICGRQSWGHLPNPTDNRSMNVLVSISKGFHWLCHGMMPRCMLLYASGEFNVALRLYLETKTYFRLTL